jgi:hypothetical protein
MAQASVQLPRGTRTVEDEDDLEQLSRPKLTRRKDFIDKEEEARKSPNRVLYFRRNADYDRLIEVCSRKIAADAGSVRALLIRASSYLKKGARAAAAARSGSDRPDGPPASRPAPLAPRPRRQHRERPALPAALGPARLWRQIRDPGARFATRVCRTQARWS